MCGMWCISVVCCFQCSVNVVCFVVYGVLCKVHFKVIQWQVHGGCVWCGMSGARLNMYDILCTVYHASCMLYVVRSMLCGVSCAVSGE